MRGVHVAAAAVVALLLGSYSSAQGLGDVAAQEKERKKAEERPAAKVYTEDDLGPSMAPVGAPESLPSSVEEGAEAGEGSAEPGATEEPPTEEDERAQAEEAWRKKLDQARQEEQVYRDIIDKLQLELNDMSGGVYNPGRAARMSFLEENQQKLADVQQRIADLEEEGRRNGYR